MTLLNPSEILMVTTCYRPFQIFQFDWLTFWSAGGLKMRLLESKWQSYYGFNIFRPQLTLFCIYLQLSNRKSSVFIGSMDRKIIFLNLNIEIIISVATMTSNNLESNVTKVFPLGKYFQKHNNLIRSKIQVAN